MYIEDSANTKQSLKSQSGQQQSTSKGILSKVAELDFFEFLPVPLFSQEPRTSKRSKLATHILTGLIVAYILSTLLGFLRNNTPKTSNELELIGEDSFRLPDIAFAVIPDMEFGISLVDQTIYGINIYQGTLYEGLSKPRNETLIGTNYDCKPKWLPKMNFTSFVCPVQPGNLKGNLFTSSEFQYVRVDFFTCKDGATPGITCQDETTIKNTLRGARFFLFIEQDETFYSNNINAFKALFYYPVFANNQKYEIYLANEVMISHPDYFYSYTTKTKQALFYNKEKTYVSELLPGQENVLITVWLRLSEEQSKRQKVPETVPDMIGKWGALSRVLISIAALYFLRFNKNRFYRKNPHWENFGEHIEKIQPKEKTQQEIHHHRSKSSQIL